MAIRIFYAYIFCLIQVAMLLAGCNKTDGIPKGKVECPWDFRISTPVVVNNLRSIMKLGDTLKFSITIPFRSFNLVTNDSINISLFSDVWGGVLVGRQIHFSEATIPGLYYIKQRDAFSYSTVSNVFENDKDNESLLFKYQKTGTDFRVNINCIARMKGTFIFNFLSSGSRDAFCSNSMPHFVANYLNTDFIYLLNEAIGKEAIPNNIVLPTNYYIKVE